MTTEEKIQKILDNADTCRWRIEQVIARISNPEAPLSGGVAEWLRKIGVEDERIEDEIDDALSPEARRAMFHSLMDRYHLNNQATAALLGCSVALIAGYRSGSHKIPIKRLMELQRLISVIDSERGK